MTTSRPAGTVVWALPYARYEVQCGDKTIMRNRRFLKFTGSGRGTTTKTGSRVPEQAGRQSREDECGPTWLPKIGEHRSGQKAQEAPEQESDADFESAEEDEPGAPPGPADATRSLRERGMLRRPARHQ